MSRRFDFGNRAVVVRSKEEKQAVIDQAIDDGYAVGPISADTWREYGYVGYDSDDKHVTAWKSTWYVDGVVSFQEWENEVYRNISIDVRSQDVLNLL